MPPARLILRDRSMDSHGIVLAVTGSDDPLILLDAARQLRRDLFRRSTASAGSICSAIPASRS